MADTLTITDNRTGKLYEIPITDGAIRATDPLPMPSEPELFQQLHEAKYTFRPSK